MRKIGFITLAFLIGTAKADALDASVYDCKETIVRINEVPLPRENQVLVPWTSVRGTWVTDSNIFVLGRVFTHQSKKYISVKMLDSRTKEVLKQGGVAIRSGAASGILTDLTSNSKYKKPDDTFIILRAFKEIDNNGRRTKRDMFVVTIRTLKERVRICEETHHELIRP